MVLASSPANAAPTTERVSLTTDESEVQDNSYASAVSDGGAVVVFDSYSRDLVAGDTNEAQDVFVRDRDQGVTERVSVGSDEGQAAEGGRAPSVSIDGRYVAFESWSPDLVPGDTNDTSDIFVRDRQTGTTERVSINSEGKQTKGPGGRSSAPSISGDGRYVAFESRAGNLVPGDANHRRDVFVHDRTTGTTELVSVRSNGDFGNDRSSDPAISGDGRFVAFSSAATNLTKRDSNDLSDAFAHDRLTGRTVRVSVGDTRRANGYSSNVAISGNGRYVAFESEATNLVAQDTNGRADVFVRNLVARTTSRVSVRSNEAQANDWSYEPAISADGRYVVFASVSTNLVSNDTNHRSDVFLRDRHEMVTMRVSIGADGEEARRFPPFGGSGLAAISPDGTAVTFSSSASNLVSKDTNDDYDVFVREPLS